MAKSGRKPVLDTIKKMEILAIVAVGCSRRTAAKYVGCSVSTIQNTADREPEFAEDLRKREQQTEIAYMKNINSAAKKAQYWRAAAWALERRNPEDFVRRSPDVITIDQIRRLLAQFAEVIVDEVPVAAYRKNILKRLDSLTTGLSRSRKRKEDDS